MEIKSIKPHGKPTIENPTIKQVEETLINSTIHPIVIRTDLGVGVVDCLCMNMVDHPDICGELNKAIGAEAISATRAEEYEVDIAEFALGGLLSIMKLDMDGEKAKSSGFKALRDGLILQRRGITG